MESGIMDKPIVVIGLGQDFEDLPPSYRREIERAEVLVGGKRQLAPFASCGIESITITPPISRIMERIDTLSKGGKQVVVLCDGDPLFFGLGRSLVDRFSVSRVKILPHVSVAQRAGAHLGISVKDMEVVSLHGREDIFPLLDAISRNKWTGIYTDKIYSPSQVAEILLKRRTYGFNVHVFESVGTNKERYFRGDLHQISNKVFSEPNFLILERTFPPPVSPHLGMKDSAFVSDGGQITKREVRTLCVSALSPLEDMVVWDLGAGCGSVSMEVLWMGKGCRVYAVEKNPLRVEMIYKNRDRFGLYAIEIVQGDIEEVIEHLPSPHRIFMGGGISRNKAPLEKAWDMLRPGGKLVVSTVLLETMNVCLEFCRDRSISFEIFCVHVDRGEPLGRGIRFVPQNPVTIFTLKKEIK